MEINKNILIVLGILISVGFVFAVTTINLPVASGNYTGTLTVNITVDANGANNMTNITCYSNSSGGAATTWLTEILNDSVSDTEFANTTILVTGFTETTTYNISCNVYNGTTLNQTISNAGITVDSTAPNVSTFYNTLNGGNYSGSKILNVSVNDATIGIDSVYFNVTYPNGTQLNWTVASGTSYYNAILDTSGFVDGDYNITVYANDSLDNLNNSEQISIVIDNTAPVITHACTDSVIRTGTIICTCTATDATSEVNGLVSFTENPTTSSTGTFTTTCTATDYAGNSIVDSESYTVTSSGTSSGGGPAVSFWQQTYVQNSQEFSEFKELNKVLAKRYRIKLKIDNENHYVGLVDLTSTQATINISSEPQQAKLNVGDEKKFEVTEDNYYDMLVKLNSIENNKANITVTSIYEMIETEVIEDESVIEKVGEIIEGAKEKGNLTWLWIVIGIIILGALGWMGYNKYNKNTK